MMNMEKEVQLFPTYAQPAEGITSETEFEDTVRGIQVNRVLATGVSALCIGMLGAQNGLINPASAEAFQHGDVASQPDGRLNNVIGTKKVKLSGDYTLQVDQAMIDQYNATCQYALDPWENWAMIRNLGTKNPANTKYVNFNRSGSAMLHKNKDLTKNHGITITVPRCGDAKNRNRISELPDWEPQVEIGVEDLGKEADTIRQRTMCTKFPKAWWEYRVRRINPELRDNFTGITITIPFPDVTPASIGLQIRFGSKRNLAFPICAKEDRSKGFKKLPTIPASRIIAVPLTPQNTERK